MKPIKPQRYVCYQATETPKIDGRLDDKVWNAAPWTVEFADIEGPGHPQPRFRTTAKMLWDADYFYIAVQMEEPHVWGTLVKHDSVIFHDNDFEVFIDPNGDNHQYYEFEMNALNTGWDLFLPRPYSDGGSADDGWEIPGLKTAVYVDGTLNDPTDVDKGWSVEIAIPWRTLQQHAHRPAPPRNGDQWRIDFSRVEWEHEVKDGKYQKVKGKREDNWVWSPQGIVNMHRPERWGYVQFSTANNTKEDATNFRADPTEAGREALMEVYHRQKSFKQKNDRWATSLEELQTPALFANFPKRPTFELTDGGYHVTLGIPLGDNRTHQWRLRQDSRLWQVGRWEKHVDTIKATLNRQAAAWNRGDIDAFMQDYWKSEQLTFSSGGQTTRGWQATKARYHLRYPSKERMGHLTFGNLEVSVLEETSAMVLGRWHLKRKDDELGGNFSLVFRQIDGQWVIVHDHSSLDYS
ncbi:MAG: ketosteroid isomerase-like protein [Pirellulaceae bacterium]|jgi:ketosteroid isomerase-like protein